MWFQGKHDHHMRLRVYLVYEYELITEPMLLVKTGIFVVNILKAISPFWWVMWCRFFPMETKIVFHHDINHSENLEVDTPQSRSVTSCLNWPCPSYDRHISACKLRFTCIGVLTRIYQWLPILGNAYFDKYMYTHSIRCDLLTCKQSTNAYFANYCINHYGKTIIHDEFMIWNRFPHYLPFDPAITRGLPS